MLPSHHAAAAAVVAVPLLARRRSPAKVALFAAAAVLIDVDHYLSFVWRIRDLSLVRAYWWHRGKTHHPYRLHRPALVIDRPRPLHAPAVLVLLAVLARRWTWLRPIVAGMVFHRLLDYAWSGVSALGVLRGRTK